MTKTFSIEGSDYLEKTVTRQSDTAGKVYLPAGWIGEKIAVIRLPEPSVTKRTVTKRIREPLDINVAKKVLGDALDDLNESRPLDETGIRDEITNRPEYIVENDNGKIIVVLLDQEKEPLKEVVNYASNIKEAACLLNAYRTGKAIEVDGDEHSTLKWRLFYNGDGGWNIVFFDPPGLGDEGAFKFENEILEGAGADTREEAENLIAEISKAYAEFAANTEKTERNSMI